MELLGYQCLQAVLKYMDPNRRRQLVHRIPALHTAEQVTPLRINNLVFDTNVTVVNDVSYTITLFRRYDDPNIPAETIIGFDLDEYGFKTDVSLSPTSTSDVVLIMDPERINIQQHLQELQDAEENLLLTSIAANQHTIALYQNTIHLYANAFPGTYLDQEITKEALNKISEAEAEIVKTQWQLLPYEYRRANEMPPYTVSIQLTISSEEEERVYHMPYTMRVGDAFRKLHGFLFGNHEIQVNSLNFRTPILRWPSSDLKLKLVNQLETFDWEFVNFDSLPKVLSESCFPLNKLVLNCQGPERRNARHSAVREAKQLVIYNANGWDFDYGLLFFVNAFSNLYIHLETEITRTPNDYLNIVRIWMGHGKEIGAYVSARIKNKDTVVKFFRRLLKRPDVIEETERSVKLQMKIGSILDVSCEEMASGAEWLLEMKVVEGNGMEF